MGHGTESGKIRLRTKCLTYLCFEKYTENLGLRLILVDQMKDIFCAAWDLVVAVPRVSTGEMKT